MNPRSHIWGRSSCPAIRKHCHLPGIDIPKQEGSFVRIQYRIVHSLTHEFGHPKKREKIHGFPFGKAFDGFRIVNQYRKAECVTPVPCDGGYEDEPEQGLFEN